MKVAEEKSFSAEIEIILADHLTIKNKEVKFIWGDLPGTGNTSQRRLVKVLHGEEIRRFVIKRYNIYGKPEESSIQAKREYQVMRYLQTVKGTNWTIPCPAAYLPEHATIVMEYSIGENLNSMFWNAIRYWVLSRSHVKWFSTLITDIAKIIQNMQTISLPDEWLRNADIRWYSYFLEEQIDALGDFGVDEHRLAHIREKVSRMLPRLMSSSSPCFQHTDLYFNNILYNNGKYCILDFPNACNGTRYWDISHLLCSLDDYRLFRNVDQCIIDICRKEFLSRFDLDKCFLECMSLIHSCFSFKLAIMRSRVGVKRIFIRDPWVFYYQKIDKLLRCD